MQIQTHRRVYLSPHLDDVVYSCGGQVWQQARARDPVLVVTFFAASPSDAAINPYTLELRERWGNALDPVAARRTEDARALKILAAQALHLPFLDCVYRQDPQTGQVYYPTVETIFGEVHASERMWHEELARALLSPVGDLGSATVYAPLTVGHHVDHILVQRVAFELLRLGHEVRYYEDFPYSGDAHAVARVLRDRPGECWSSEMVPLAEEALRAKVAAVACYASQTSTFWANMRDMEAAFRAQALLAGKGRLAETYWQVQTHRR